MIEVKGCEDQIGQRPVCLEQILVLTNIITRRSSLFSLDLTYNVCDIDLMIHVKGL